MWTIFSKSERPKLPHKSSSQEEGLFLRLCNEDQVWESVSQEERSLCAEAKQLYIDGRFRDCEMPEKLNRIGRAHHEIFTFGDLLLETHLRSITLVSCAWIIAHWFIRDIFILFIWTLNRLRLTWNVVITKSINISPLRTHHFTEETKL